MIYQGIVDVILDLLGTKVTGEEAERLAAEILDYIQREINELLED